MAGTTTSLLAIPKSPWPGRFHDALGGGVAALFTLPGALAFGAIALAPLGEAGQALGVTAGLVGAVVGGLVAALAGGFRGGIAAPSGQLAVLLAVGVSSVVAGSGIPPLAVACLAGLTVAMAGLVQLLLGCFRLGGIITYVPYPVIAGCAIGAGGVIAMSQVAPLLGLPAHLGLADVLQGEVLVRPGALLVGVATAVGVSGGRLIPRIPDVVVGLAAGVVAHLLLAWLNPETVGSGVTAPEISALAVTVLPEVLAIGDAWRQILGLVPVAIGMGLLAAVLSLVAAAIAEGATRRRVDGNRELVAQGLANLASGLCGGVAVALSESRTLVSWQAGGRGRLAGVAHALVLLVAGTLLVPLIVRLPQAVLAGLLLVMTVRAVDPWAVDLLRLALRGGDRGRLPGREVAGNLAVITLVAGLTMAMGMSWGLLAGLLVAVVEFIASMSGSPVRRVLRGDAVRSKKLRSDRAMETLATHGGEIALCELQGSLFFGTAERLSRDAERLLIAGVRTLILDCKRVSTVDSSGARMVQRLDEDCRALGGRLFLAQLDRSHPGYAVFRGLGVLTRLGEDALLEDADAALEVAEEGILARHQVAATSGVLDLVGLDIAEGLTPEQCAVLRRHFDLRTFEADEIIFHEGGPGDGLFLLVEGEVSVRTRVEDGRSVRLSTFSPGVVFGEMALLDGAPRSASVVADVESVCLILPVGRYVELGRDHPALAQRFALNLARQLAGRLRRANAQIRALER